MNDHDLGRMLDQAAREFLPDTDPARLHHVLRGTQRRRRGIVVALSAAAGIAAIAGTTFAVQPGERPQRIAPAHEPAFSTDTTTPTTGKDASVTTAAASDGRTKPTAPPPGTDGRVKALIEPPTGADHTLAPTTLGPKTTSSEVPASAKPDPEPTLKPVTKPTAPPSTKPPAPPTTTKSTVPPTSDDSGVTTTKPPSTNPPVEFSAFQTYGKSGGDPPYETLYGHATPGSTVTVSSAFGGAAATANEKGKWMITLYFPTSPFDEPFTLSVTSEQGSADFSFVRTS